MITAPNHILNKLRQEILLLEGYKAPETGTPEILVGPLAEAFPNRRFPTGKLHEFIAPTPQRAAASGAFIAAIAGKLLSRGGDCIWIAKKGRIFPPGLVSFGIQPHRVVFCEAKNDKLLLWAAEEAMKASGIVAVVAEIAEINYPMSLRLQSAIEDSGITGMLLRQGAKTFYPIASTARWRISPARSRSPIPGVSRIGVPSWTVQLEKVRNGRAGIWQLEWSAGQFQALSPEEPGLLREPWRKTG